MFWKKWFSKNKEITIDEVRAIVVSDIGRVRANNEDNAVFIKPSRQNHYLGYLGIVADGMGGHQAGEVASRLATEIIPSQYYKKGDNPITALYFAFSKANREIWQKAKSNTAFSGMGTTCTAVVIINEKIYVGHIGDSRIYLLKDGLLTQISTDHTYVMELLKQGVITAAEADTHPERNILTRVMGTKYEADFDIFEVKETFTMGSRLLLCSDGLYDYFTREELVEQLSEPVLGKIPINMIELVKQRGGHDNITVMVIERVPEVSTHSGKITGEYNLI